MEMNTSLRHPSSLLCAMQTLAHGHASSRSLSYMKSTHNYTPSCSQLQRNLSAARVWSQWAALHRWARSLSCLGGGRPPLSRYYLLPSNIHQLPGDSWRQVHFDRLTMLWGGRSCVHMQVCEFTLTRYNQYTHGMACAWRLPLQQI